MSQQLPRYHVLHELDHCKVLVINLYSMVIGINDNFFQRAMQERSKRQPITIALLHVIRTFYGIMANNKGRITYCYFAPGWITYWHGVKSYLKHDK